MMDDMMKNFKANQEAVEKHLAQVRVKGESGGGAIEVEADGKGEILNISIDKEKIDVSDVEELEDLLLVAVNRAIYLAQKEQKSQTEKSLNSMLPGGLGGLSGLFG